MLVVVTLKVFVSRRSSEVARRSDRLNAASVMLDGNVLVVMPVASMNDLASSLLRAKGRKPSRLAFGLNRLVWRLEG